MAILLDATSSAINQTDIVTPFIVSWSHTCTGSNLILLVAHSSSDPADTISGITYNGVALTKAKEQVNTGANISSLWYLVAPATGANTIEVTSNNSVTNVNGMALSLTGVDQTTPIDAAGVGNQADAADSISVSITTVTDGAWVVDAVTKELSANSMVVASGQTQRVLLDGTAVDSGMSTKEVATAGATSVGWNDDGSPATFDWAIAAVAIRPAGAAAAADEKLLQTTMVGKAMFTAPTQ